MKSLLTEIVNDKFDNSKFNYDLNLILNQTTLNEPIEQLLQMKNYTIDHLINEYETLEQQKVTCGMIVRNEEQNILNCVNSIRDHVDDIIIIDAFSTDNTLSLLKEVEGLKVYQEQWPNDFAKQRNRVIEKAETDWIYFIDADNTFLQKNKDHLQRIATLLTYLKVKAIGSPVIFEHDGKITTDNHRLLPLKLGARFEGRVHEEVVLPEKDIAHHLLISIEVKHSGYQEKELLYKKAVRNSKLSLKMLKEEPNNPKWNYFAARDLYLVSKDNNKYAIELLKEGIAKYNGNIGPYKLMNLILQCEIASIIEDNKTLLIATSELKGFDNLIDYYFFAIPFYIRNEKDKAAFMINEYQKIAGMNRPYSVIDRNFRHVEEMLISTSKTYRLFELETFFYKMFN